MKNQENFMMAFLIAAHSPVKSHLGWPRIKAFPKKWTQIWKSILITYVLPRVRLNPLGRCFSLSHTHTPLPHVSTNSEDETTKCNDSTTTSTSFDISSPLFRDVVAKVFQNLKKAPRWLRAIWAPSKLTPKTIHEILSGQLL